MRVICLCCQSSMNRLKVLFLNNAIDQGVYYPLGMQQASVNGKSIFFMVASNPESGPGAAAGVYLVW